MHCGLKSKNFVPVWIRSAVLHARFRLARAAANNHIHCTSETGELSLPVFCLARDEKTDLPNVKGEVKRAIKATFAHLCTTLTRDKCLPLLAVKGESSGDKGRFCHAFNPYLWRASKVYFISICTPIKGVVKYVWDSGQRCDKSAVKLCLWLKSKACEKCRQMCLSLRSNVWQSCCQMRLRFKSKV